MSNQPKTESAVQFSATQVDAMRARRRSKRRRRPGLSPTVNIAPMIDVSFLLLIFFLVTTTFERAEGILSSNLPKERGDRPAVSLPISPIVLRLQQTGPDHDDFSISIDRFEDAPQRFVELPQFLRGIFALPGFDEETPVVIVASNDLAWDHVVAAWNAAVRADAKRIAFAEP